MSGFFILDDTDSYWIIYNLTHSGLKMILTIAFWISAAVSISMSILDASLLSFPYKLYLRPMCLRMALDWVSLTLSSVYQGRLGKANFKLNFWLPQWSSAPVGGACSSPFCDDVGILSVAIRVFEYLMIRVCGVFAYSSMCAYLWRQFCVVCTELYENLFVRSRNFTDEGKGFQKGIVTWTYLKRCVMYSNYIHEIRSLSSEHKFTGHSLHKL